MKKSNIKAEKDDFLEALNRRVEAREKFLLLLSGRAPAEGKAVKTPRKKIRKTRRPK